MAITQAQHILKNGQTCVKWAKKGGYVQVWQRNTEFWPFMCPYLQRIGVIGLVVTGMAINGARQAEKINGPQPGVADRWYSNNDLELSQVHVTLLGKSLVQGKGFVKGVAGLSLLGNLEVIPHQLLVVRVNTVLNYTLGTLGG